MNNMDGNSLLQEIEEDLARQRFEAVWKKYGNLLLTCALLIVLATAGMTSWKSYSLHQKQRVTQAYLSLLDKEMDEKQDEKENLAPAYEAFAKENAGTQIVALARFQEAGQLLKNDKKDEALKTYDALAADKSVDQIFRQLADLLYVKTDLDTGDEPALQKRLEPLIKQGPWRFLAKEFSGHLAVRVGDKTRAKTIFTEIAAMEGLPKGVGLRAGDMLMWLDKGE